MYKLRYVLIFLWVVAVKAVSVLPLLLLSIVTH